MLLEKRRGIGNFGKGPQIFDAHSEFCVAAISMRFSVNQDETRAGV
ncbi:hypothetical protein HF265_15465 [Rhizobium leguminosarum]|nr:hypothetical protein [Rhizobium leguminosarum]MBY3030496.1 hypothetical protein [Rhizobium leguminosarum]